MKWTWSKLYVALDKLEVLDTTASAFGETSTWDAMRQRGRIHRKPAAEALAHEVFHGVLLCGEVVRSSTLADKIRKLTAHDSDTNELETLAAELVFFERLGLLNADDTQAALDKLVDFAFDQLRYYGTAEEVETVVKALLTDDVVLRGVEKVFELIGGEPPT
jgi:hypothetical protein